MKKTLACHLERKVYKGPVFALTEEDVPLDNKNYQSRVFNYEITSDIVEYLKAASLKSVLFWDKRTGHGTPTSPYKDLLKDQIECLTVIARGK